MLEFHNGCQLKRLIKSALLSFMLFALCACASVPKAIQADFDNHLTLAVAHQDFANAIGKMVRWGGRIATVENVAHGTWLEIVEHALYSNGKPRPSDQTGGRFRAFLPEFLDPAIYAEGRPVTIVGVVERLESRTLGQQQYLYPIILSEGHHLWPVPIQRYADYTLQPDYVHCPYGFFLCNYYWYPRVSIYVSYHHHRHGRHGRYGGYGIHTGRHHH